MVESSTSFFFKPIDPLKHNHTPQKAAILSTLHYLHDQHIHV